VNDHPDDLAARTALAAAIRQHRIDLGLSQRVYARRLGVTQSAVPYFEGRTNHLVGTAQRYARAADHLLTLKVHGLPPVVDGTVMSYHQLAHGSSDPTMADAYHRAAVLETLRVVRIDSGRPARTIARAMECGETAVLQFEAGWEDVRMATLQRYARALGGRLELVLQSVDEAPEVARV
jgi:transcriptional regulator with XRE-family HTH domain